jgi:hypothetical protein
MHNGYGQVTLVTTLLCTVGTKVSPYAKASTCAKASARRTAGVPVAAGTTPEGVSGATTETAETCASHGTVRTPSAKASARRTAGVPVAAGTIAEGVSGATTEAAGNLCQPAGRRADTHQARRRAASDAQ